jgi:hypothetical protein
MRIALPALAILLALVPISDLSAACPTDGPPASRLGPGRAGTVRLQTVVPGDADLYTEHCDGTFEDGYCWRRDGIGDPYYGAFAERFTGPAHVVGMRVYLSTIYDPPYERASDMYVWGDGVIGPGAVLAVLPDVVFTAIPFWPEVGGFDFPITAETGPVFYVGSQADFGPGTEYCYYFNGADCNGSGGSPWTCVKPGLGYPSGWQSPSQIWGPTNAMGYGVYTADYLQGIGDAPADGSADPGTTWSAVKNLFRR